MRPAGTQRGGSGTGRHLATRGAADDQKGREEKGVEKTAATTVGAQTCTRFARPLGERVYLSKCVLDKLLHSCQPWLWRPFPLPTPLGCTAGQGSGQLLRRLDQHCEIIQCPSLVGVTRAATVAHSWTRFRPVATPSTRLAFQRQSAAHRVPSIVHPVVRQMAL